MVSVAPAEARDLHAIAELLEEMDRFYGVTEFETTEQRAAQIEAMIFRSPPAARVLVAKDGERLIGLAAYSFLWPAVGLTQSMFLKELYVAQTHRRNGLGRHLMRTLREIVAETGCSRVEWMTDRTNPDAQRFYASLGFEEDTTKVFYRAL